MALSFFGIGMKTDLYQSCGIAEFSKFADILSVALSQHHHLGFEMAHNKYKILKETIRENIFDLRFGKIYRGHNTESMAHKGKQK